MTSENFVSAVKLVVEKNGFKDITSNLEAFPETINDDKWKALSSWFNNLDLIEKEYVKQIVAESFSTALFGFFCVLDGVRVIEAGSNKGELKLYYSKGGENVLINNPETGDFLHDIYNSYD
jgi:hypothetical protein